MMKQKNKIVCSIALYLVFAIWFLNCQFQSSKQSPFMSKQMLLPSLTQQKLQGQIIQSKGKNYKVIFLLIDSAKYSYWQQFSVIKQLVQKHPEHSILAKTIVSQPTMTTQKIQTLMTGSQIFSVTSIIDAFFGSSVTIDNIIHQLDNHNKKTVNLGDDTWSKLFNFKISYPCVTTFDIWDWQTCDLIIYKNLIQQIQKGNQFIVAHFLALDHIGHSSSSTSHPSFKDKKQQMSQFIRKVIARMDGNTVLIVTGDHGMRDDGNHGGATSSETESFVFAYIKQNNLVLLERTNLKQIKNIRQPDITTTLSLILGIPIPFNSIGIPLFIPQHLANKQNNYSQQISENLKKHFINLMSYHNIVCPSFNSLSENIQLTKLKQIQQNCLSHLSHSQPNLILISISILLMGIVGLCVAYILGISIKQYIMVLILMVPHSFSWLFIRNSSSYFLICLLIVLTFIKMSIKSKTMILGFILMLAQFEPVKNGEYALNWMANRQLSLIVARYQLHITATILWCYYQIRKTIFYSPNLRITKAYVEPQAILYVLQLLTTMFVTISHICRKIQILQLQKILNIVILFLFVISIIIAILSHAQPNKQLKQQRIIRLLQYCLILFLGPNALVIYLFIMFSFTLLATDQPKQSIYKYKQFNGYFCYLLGHFIWWTIGSRYQYSSIDIKQSYIFSNTYHSIINPICLLIFMIAPYLISYIIMLNPVNRRPTHFVSLNQSEQTHSSDNSRETIYISDSRESKQQRNKLKVKYILMPLCWLVCCCISVVYNNQKILYTVVYVPMLVIEVGKISMMIVTMLAVL